MPTTHALAKCTATRPGAADGKGLRRTTAQAAQHAQRLSVCCLRPATSPRLCPLPADRSKPSGRSCQGKGPASRTVRHPKPPRRSSPPLACRLSLTGSLATPLPDILPGALPRLTSLYLGFPGLRSTLPAAWGSDPAILPALQALQVLVQVEGGLPAAWGTGFPQLQGLIILNFPPNSSLADLHGPDEQALDALIKDHGVRDDASTRQAGRSSFVARADARRLPAEWAAAGRFSKLEGLQLDNLGLVGTLPLWSSGGLPKLQRL